MGAVEQELLIIGRELVELLLVHDDGDRGVGVAGHREVLLDLVELAGVVGLGIEFIVAQWRREEIQEGFLVTGLILPMICPIDTPLWMVALATAFAVIFAKEVFGGTGYNIVNIALTARAFLFFAYPSKMSGDKAFVATDRIGSWAPAVPDGFTCATPLGEVATSTSAAYPFDMFHGVGGQDIDAWQAFVGLIPGSFGETSTLCIDSIIHTL